MTSIAEYYALRPGDYGPIVRLSYSQSERMGATEDVIEHELELVLSKFPELSGERLLLRFEGVSEIRFSQPSWSLAAFGLIEIHECDSGFLATEEEGLIGFRFKRFDARLESEARMQGQ